MASGAGLNKVGNNGGVFLLTSVTSAATPIAVTAPTAPAYGTLGANDSGIVMAEGIAFTKWAFQIIQQGTTAASGYTFTLYGTISPGAHTAFMNQRVGIYTNTTDVRGMNWFQLPAPSEQGGTSVVVNPLTALGQVMLVSMPLVAVRAVLTATSTPLGQVAVIGFAVP
jgi:hypothetical protein